MASHAGQMEIQAMPFDIADSGVAIGKVTNGSNFEPLAATTAPVQANAWNRLRAVCTSVEGQQAVHLVFWVNGKKLADVTDTKNPFTGGTVGLFAATDQGQTAVEAEFDNFAVTQP
jgi:hypothetical protein